jgi:tetratricopeptide (TPR) repeat protein
MKTMEIQELHSQAMELADKADLLKRQGKADEAGALFRQSLEAERKAAIAARQQQTGEPTESVLFRSAATLAYTIGDYREAERLVCLGLAGNPPAEITEELRNLYDTVSMERNISQIDASSVSTEQESVTITIPIRERNLLNVLVRKFGWACVF